MTKSWFVSLVLAASCTATLAEVLSPGGIVVGQEETRASAARQLHGTVVEDTTVAFGYSGFLTDYSGITPVTVSGPVSGTVRTRVVLADDGTYDFYWQVSVDPTSFLPVALVQVGGLLPTTYDVGWRRNGKDGIPPATVAQRDNGDLVWAFGQYVPPSSLIYPGAHSHFVFLDTDATAYKRAQLTLVSEEDSGGNTQIEWGGISSALDTFGPAPGVSIASRSKGAPAAIAGRFISGDAILQTLPGPVRGCIIGQIAEQQARYWAYGPQGGPYDSAAIQAAARSFAAGCR